ncbi:nuclear transport factor 2 family protein [Pedobacter gandavensis]|uniref:Nuclear transport factor 2 family protein n=1 Tax=Pedobacter gandavensis TaxID=2679963 RepID=A0ABR6F2V3_9SPHI|nr:nuclear transport factor 2 family protein [Pedobacter gandavensis]MBB2151003.1 nuclear transport factor 2 family protein [Pedobacter gandavensis]
MNANQELITKFYTAFQNKDITGMQECYSDQATFSDPVFTNLNAKELRSMWAMLIQSGKDMRIEFSAVESIENGARAHWDAYYTFSATGNKVLNQVDAHFVIENGKIIQHQDQFDFYKWSKQALGLTGMLLGWTSFLRNKVRKQASAKLAAYISRKNPGINL